MDRPRHRGSRRGQHPPAGRPLTFFRSFLVLLACLAVPALAQDPVPRPEVKPGDRWTYRKINLWDIEVPAGKFRALKVEGNGTYQRQDIFGNGKIHYVIWYAPEVKRWVKYTVENTDFKGNPNLRETDELVEFKLQ